MELFSHSACIDTLENVDGGDSCGADNLGGSRSSGGSQSIIEKPAEWQAAAKIVGPTFGFYRYRCAPAHPKHECCLAQRLGNNRNEDDPRGVGRATSPPPPTRRLLLANEEAAQWAAAGRWPAPHGSAVFSRVRAPRYGGGIR